MSTVGVPFPKIEAVTFRELRPDETEKLMPFLREQGWGLPYPYLASAIVGEYEGQIVSFAIVQLVPHTEPLWVEESWRGSGLAERTAFELKTYMERAGNRVWVATGGNRFTERICRLMGMKEIATKVFVKE